MFYKLNKNMKICEIEKNSKIMKNKYIVYIVFKMQRCAQLNFSIVQYDRYTPSPHCQTKMHNITGCEQLTCLPT